MPNVVGIKKPQFRATLDIDQSYLGKLSPYPSGVKTQREVPESHFDDTFERLNTSEVIVERKINDPLSYGVAGTYRHDKVKTIRCYPGEERA